MGLINGIQQMVAAQFHGQGRRLAGDDDPLEYPEDGVFADPPPEPVRARRDGYMNACVLSSGRFSFTEVPVPVPQEGEVLLEVRSCGISSSDIAITGSSSRTSGMLIPGHEISGVIVGGDAFTRQGRDLQGKRAAVYPLVPCRTCPECLRGNYHRCSRYSFIGGNRPGGFAEYVAVPTENLFLLPDSVSFEEGAMIEPAAVALHAVRRADVTGGDTCLVIGCGPVGVLTAMWADIQGAGQTIVIGRRDRRIERADEICRDLFSYAGCLSAAGRDTMSRLQEMTMNLGGDKVFEATGSEYGLRLAVSAARRGGTVVLIGRPVSSITLGRDLYRQILCKELTLTGTWNSQFFPRHARSEWDEVLDRILTTELPLSRLISHSCDLEDLKTAVTSIRASDGDVMQVVVDMTGASADGFGVDVSA